MKNIALTTLMAALCCGYGCTNAQQKPALIWAEEFDYTGLPDSSKWKYETGMVRNNEAQYYTVARLENAEVRGGSLVITARKEAYEKAEYTSASIHTKGIFSFQGGRVEVRAKLPEGRGTWPAIWTLGENNKRWPDCGEIDIMEFVGYNPGTVHANVHTRDYNHTKNTGRGGTIAIERPFDDFHIYAVEWFDDRMDFYLDDTMYYTCQRKGEGEGEWPFDTPQYLKINLAIGGEWGGQKGIDDGIFPVEYSIDYVRIYSSGK
ncbi:MAG: glycoside hydrolase family 16 protein [Tannerella sp.]|nr:glycoside hydrolase family 16 protein [Tannerella sp.]